MFCISAKAGRAPKRRITISTFTTPAIPCAAFFATPRGAEHDHNQEWWEGISDYEITAYEDAAMYQGATQETLLDNTKIEAILANLGLSTSKLSMGGAIVDPVLFSRRPGGQPIRGY